MWGDFDIYLGVSGRQVGYPIFVLYVVREVACFVFYFVVMVCVFFLRLFFFGAEVRKQKTLFLFFLGFRKSRILGTGDRYLPEDGGIDVYWEKGGGRRGMLTFFFL